MSALPVIRGTSALLHPYKMTVLFRTVVGRFQNGAEQRSIADPGGLIQFDIPYSKLSQAQKNTLKSYVATARGGFDTTGSLVLGAITYTNLILDSDEFSSIESKPAQYGASLKLSQVVTQNFSPGTPGLAFPTLANGSIGMLPFKQRQIWQTMGAKVAAGPNYTTPEFGGGFTGYPSTGLMGWEIEERMLSDADAATLLAHFIANWGRAYSFPFTGEDATTYSHANGNGSPHYSSDSLVFTHNGPDDTDVKIAIELTNN
ncbi:MAG TPA: hypothetical protein VHY84_27405 [Bryobacteraceae bacterium]|jgi:hypothetical protein|nr:hypothetical protein [Bryobacteraceae bacterium]